RDTESRWRQHIPSSCQGLALASKSCRGKGLSGDIGSLFLLRSPRLRLRNSWMPGPRPGMTMSGGSIQPDALLAELAEDLAILVVPHQLGDPRRADQAQAAWGSR